MFRHINSAHTNTVHVVNDPASLLRETFCAFFAAHGSLIRRMTSVRYVILLNFARAQVTEFH